MPKQGASRYPLEMFPYQVDAIVEKRVIANLHKKLTNLTMSDDFQYIPYFERDIIKGQIILLDELYKLYSKRIDKF